MEKRLKENNFQHLKTLLLASFFTISALISIAFLGLFQVEKEMRSDLTEHLRTTLNSNVEILNFWFQGKKVDAEVVASNPELQEKILRLIELAGKSLPVEELQASPGLHWVRDHLSTIINKYGFVGFVIFNTEGRQVGAHLDSPIGKHDLKERSDFFHRSLKGNTVVSLPFTAEVDLPDIHGVLRKNWPTMFVSTPVKDPWGQIQAILSFRIRPETEFSELLRITRFGKSGETYAFSSTGLLLSDSRFNKQLRQANLIRHNPWAPSILNIKIQNPQGNLTKGFEPDLPRKDWPLTRMAASATFGGSEVEITPYNDYRGVPVVGAWTWLDEHNLGITSEIDAQDALQPVYSLRKSFYALCAFMILAFALGIFF